MKNKNRKAAKNDSEERERSRKRVAKKKKVSSSRLLGKGYDPYFNRRKKSKYARYKRCISCKGKMRTKKEGNYYRCTCEDCGYTELKKSKIQYNV